MARLQFTYRAFALLSGIRQDSEDYITCSALEPSENDRRGMLAILAEPSGESKGFAAAACKLVQETIFESYYSNASPSLTRNLLDALESANTALLHYNHNRQRLDTPQSDPGTPIPMHLRARGAKVGVAVALLHPNGSGVYVAQTSPAQIYMWHRGVFSRLPESASQTDIAKDPPHLHLVAPENDDVAGDSPFGPQATPAVVAPPLGAAPGIEVDLVYRRLDVGDVMVLVSSTLSRYLTGRAAEDILTIADPDDLCLALIQLAKDAGLAQGHACVLQLEEAEESRGRVSSDVAPNLVAELSSQNIGEATVLASLDDFEPGVPGYVTGGADLESEDVEVTDESDQGEAAGRGSIRRFPVGKPIEVPRLFENESSEPEFGTWQKPARMTPPPVRRSTISGSLAMKDLPETTKSEVSSVWRASRLLSFLQRPVKLEATPTDGAPVPIDPTSLSDPTPAATVDPAIIGSVAAWLGSLSVASERKVDVRRILKEVVPKRPVALAVLSIVGVFLTISLAGALSHKEPSKVTTLLEQAKHEDLLANQPTASAQEKRSHLEASLASAKNALAAAPGSAESKIFIAKVQGELDEIDGITRLGGARVLFDLDASENGTNAGRPNAKAGASAGIAQSVFTGTPGMTSIAVQGNEAYLLDRQANVIYRCGISTQNCASVLRTGDTAGGQPVGALKLLTLRVGSILVLDEKLTAFLYDADTSSWQSQPLGDADKMNAPTDVASYDGNIYLLGAHTGQIVKFASGRFGDSPIDWIRDQASAEQVKDPVALAVDGSIYTLLADGKIIVLQSGQAARTLAPKGGPAGNARLFTSTDTHDLYVLRKTDGTITRISKEGQTLATYKVQLSAEVTGSPSGFTVDEGRGKIYLTVRRSVYEVPLPNPGQPGKSLAPVTNSFNFGAAGAPVTGAAVQPRPTAEP